MQKITKHSSMFLSLLLVSFIGTSCGAGTPSEKPKEDMPIETNVNSSINYQIFPRTFADSNGDGIGDLNGIKAKIPYLKSLGVKNIWLNPIHEAGSDHGYDVIDYYSISKDLGTFEDFDALVKELKANDMGLIMDMVFNHVSSQSDYFQQAYSDFLAAQSGKVVPNSKAKWFNFSGQPKSGYIKINKYYVESRFDNSGMLDFNLKNKAVIEELGKILNFWAEKGVAGYRFDAVKYFVGAGLNKDAIDVMNKLKAFQPDLYYIGEAWENDMYSFGKFFESEFDSFFTFPMCGASPTAQSIYSTTSNGFAASIVDNALSLQNTIEKYAPNKTTKSVPTYFLSNHDMDRMASICKDNESMLKLIASVNYLLPGTPFIYYGEEIGMKGERYKNVMTDADRRMPMLWGEDGGTTNELNNTTFKDQIESNTFIQKDDPTSILRHYNRVTSLRNRMGSMIRNAKISKYSPTFNKDYPKVLAYNLEGDGESYSILTNLSNENIGLTLSNDYNNVVGYINASDWELEYSLTDKELMLPTYGTIVLKN